MQKTFSKWVLFLFIVLLNSCAFSSVKKVRANQSQNLFSTANSNVSATASYTNNSTVSFVELLDENYEYEEDHKVGYDNYENDPRTIFKGQNYLYKFTLATDTIYNLFKFVLNAQGQRDVYSLELGMQFEDDSDKTIFQFAFGVEYIPNVEFIEWTELSGEFFGLESSSYYVNLVRDDVLLKTLSLLWDFEVWNAINCDIGYKLGLDDVKGYGASRMVLSLGVNYKYKFMKFGIQYQGNSFSMVDNDYGTSSTLFYVGMGI